MRIREYKICNENTPELLSAKVERAIFDDWQPYGDPYVSIIDIRNTKHCQAMVKYSEEKEKLND